MIQAKLFEVRDSCTFLPVLAVRISAFDMTQPSPWMSEEERVASRYLMRRAGYGADEGDALVILTNLHADHTTADCDPHSWPNRTLKVAHQHIAEKWDELRSGDVIDVEFLMGLRGEPKRSEREEHPL